MKKTSILISMLVALGIVFSSVSMYGAEGKGNKGKGKGDCPEIQAIKAKIEAKKDETKTIIDKIKALRGDKGKKDGNKGKKEGKKNGEKKGEKKDLTEEQKAAKLEKMKTKNPKLFALISEKKELHQEIKGLKDELKTVKAGCKGKEEKKEQKKEKK